MDDDELMALARELYETWRERVASGWPDTLWPWDALFAPEKDLWFAVAVAAVDALAALD